MKRHFLAGTFFQGNWELCQDTMLQLIFLIHYLETLLGTRIPADGNGSRNVH